MQRPGKMHRAGLADHVDSITIGQLTKFFEQAAKEVEDPFYFEQIVDYLKNHYKSSKGLESPAKVLGL